MSRQCANYSKYIVVVIEGALGCYRIVFVEGISVLVRCVAGVVFHAITFDGF
jgi:hypothetical protein